jgi:hypothetical protein
MIECRDWWEGTGSSTVEDGRDWAAVHRVDWCRDWAAAHRVDWGRDGPKARRGSGATPPYRRLGVKVAQIEVDALRPLTPIQAASGRLRSGGERSQGFRSMPVHFRKCVYLKKQPTTYCRFCIILYCTVL